MTSPPPPPPPEGQPGGQPGDRTGGYGVPYPASPQEGYSVPPPGSGPPGTGYGGPPRVSQKATWSMVVGVASLVLGICGCLGLVGLVGVVLGLLARRDIAASGGQLTGSGRATTGLVTGAVGAGIALAWLVYVAIQLANGQDLGY